MTATFNFLNEDRLKRLDISIDLHAESNYSRDKIEKTHKATCPCCLESFCVKKNGTVVRHGWKETGRRKGQYGMGFQWGECWGTSAIPLEQSDVDGLRIARDLEAQLIMIQDRIDFIVAGKQEKYHVNFARIPIMVRDERGGFNVQGGEDNFEISTNHLNMVKDFLLNEGIDYEVEIVINQPTRNDYWNRKLGRKPYKAYAVINITVDKYIDRDFDVRALRKWIRVYDMEGQNNHACYETKEIVTTKEYGTFEVGHVPSWKTCNDNEYRDMVRLKTDTKARLRQLVQKIQWHYDNPTSGTPRK